LPVFDAPPLLPVPTVAAANTLKGRGPAPTFGGSIGWKKRSADELQQVFAQQEELNKQLYHMTMDWKPSEMFYNTLTRNAIPKEFALRCLDEFVLYYSDGKKKERSWDQKFLAWVKRDWIKQQGKDNRSNEPKQSSGYQHENSQRDSREKRKRITAAIMDINDTDW
ncbi:MAG: DnaT-like ssDNA-binding domain-containing protein, partial [Pseudomonadales bacterium]